MIYLRNMFAQRELNTAKYYYERQRYVAAIERCNYLLQNYSQATSAKEAMALSYKANMKLGFKSAAQDVARVYQATYHAPLRETV